MNAVKTQVYIAIITYTLVAVIKSKLKINRSTYEMLQIMSASLFDKTHLNELLQSPINKNVKEQKCEQLKIEPIKRDTNDNHKHSHSLQGQPDYSLSLYPDMKKSHEHISEKYFYKCFTLNICSTTQKYLLTFEVQKWGPQIFVRPGKLK